MRVPITNLGFADKRRRRRRKRDNSEPVTRNLSRSEIDAWSGDDDYYPDYEEYLNFYGDGPAAANDEIDDKTEEKIENLPREIYCDIVETLEEKCGEYSLLELWRYDRDVIAKLSEQDILNAINTVDESPVFGYETNYTSYLGQVDYNSTGHVVGAKTMRSIWLEKFDPDDIPPSSKLIGFEINKADPFTTGYEREVLKVLKEWRDERETENKGYSFYMTLGLSYPEEASGPLEYDVLKQVYGYLIMFTYTLLTLGKLNIVEHKFYLAGTGILSVFFGFASAIGITMALGFPYCPQTGILPFICLGIGIDDMFVIMKCFSNIPDKEKESNGLVKNIGHTMRHAGVSITVTSLTDVVVFGIGAITYFPSMQSFSIGGALAIAIIYIFQSSWFIAWMVLDQRRIEQKRDGFLPFIVHSDWQPPEWSQDMGNKAMKQVSRLYEFRIFQSMIILLTVSMCAVGVWGVYELRVNYDPINLLPKESYLRSWIDQNDIDFPTDGWAVNFFTQEISYNLEDFEKIDMIVNDLDNLTRTHNELVHYGKKLPKTVQTFFEVATGFWWQDLKKFISEHKHTDDWRGTFSAGKFPLYLSDFLHHKDGSIYSNNFRFAEDSVCNAEAPAIKAVRLGTLKFRDLKGPTQHLPAQHALNEILERANLSSTTFANSVIYPGWEIEEILLGELHRNIAMALVSVFVIIFITLTDLRACLMILSCVMFTMVDVAGISYMMGMNLDPFYLISTIIGVGLSVDYAVHIAHSFEISEGSRKQRTLSGFIAISPAILHGGVTTFLALILLAFSESYPFITFFKIISLTVVFGLFHGLVFLPVMLMLFGTDKAGQKEESEENTENTDNSAEYNVKGTDNPVFKEADFVRSI